MILSPDEIFAKLFTDSCTPKIYKSNSEMTEGKKKALDALGAIIRSFVKKANYWSHEGDPYGFWLEKSRSKKFILLLRLIKNDNFEEAIAFIGELSNYDQRIVPIIVTSFLEEMTLSEI